MALPYESIVIDDSEDERIRLAIALTLSNQRHISTESPEPSVQSTLTRPRQAQFGSLSLDRKAMEEERLQRLGKRSRAPSDLTDAPRPKKGSSYSPSTNETKTKESPESSHGSTVPKERLSYPDGTVKRTWVQGFERRDDDIKIEEVLQKNELELAVIASYQWDEEWLMSKIDIARTNTLLLAFAKDNAQKEVMRANAPPGIRFCFPPMHGLGAMHAKLQLLKFPGYLRLVIPTGNFVPYDWGETGMLENMVFLIDLPRLENRIQPPPTSFQKGLNRFLQAMGVNNQMISSISNYDFAKTEKLGFVYTVPGSHIDESLKRIGYYGLGASVAALGLASSGPIEVDFACASIGALNHDFIKAIFKACQGSDGESRDELGFTRKIKTAAVTPKQLQEQFRIYFPTDRTVAHSKGGRQAGGTICIQKTSWTSSKFPRELLRDVITTRDRLLMHTKLILVRRHFQRGESTTWQAPGWAYVGSANLSESAWGRLSKDKATGKAKLNCRNWECGVVLPLPKQDEKPGASADVSMFVGVVPVPMQVPGPPYGPDDQPWFFSRS